MNLTVTYPTATADHFTHAELLRRIGSVNNRVGLGLDHTNFITGYLFRDNVRIIHAMEEETKTCVGYAIVFIEGKTAHLPYHQSIYIDPEVKEALLSSAKKVAAESGCLFLSKEEAPPPFWPRRERYFRSYPLDENRENT